MFKTTHGLADTEPHDELHSSVCHQCALALHDIHSLFLCLVDIAWLVSTIIAGYTCPIDPCGCISVASGLFRCFPSPR